VQSSIYKIDSSNGSTENSAHIKEFLENIDKGMFNTIQKHLDNLKEINSIKPIRVPATQDMKDKGYTEDTIEVPLVFDPSTFFV
jgi:hypothetical protein